MGWGDLGCGAARARPDHPRSLETMPRQSAVRLRIYTAPGESPDLLEVIRLPAAVEEVDHLDRIPDGGLPAVLFLSRGLLRGMGPGEWEALPAHVVVVASDAQARGEAEKAGRLFLSTEDFRGGRRALHRVLRAAARHSAALLTLGRTGNPVGRPVASPEKGTTL